MSEDKTKSWPQIRPATSADGVCIRQLVFGVLGEYGLRPDPEGVDGDLNDIEQSYLARGGMFFLLELHEGEVIGCYGLYPLDEQTCELRKMYLRREYRGKGHGRRMMEHAIARAREVNFSVMTLETASVLKEAIGLYRSFGFACYEPAYLCHRCDQAYRLRL